jgi:hypothetical protein
VGILGSSFRLFERETRQTNNEKQKTSSFVRSFRPYLAHEKKKAVSFVARWLAVRYVPTVHTDDDWFVLFWIRTYVLRTSCGGDGGVLRRSHLHYMGSQYLCRHSTYVRTSW